MKARDLILALFLGAGSPCAGADFVVTSSLGSGAGSLPAAVAAANSSPGHDRITFDLLPSSGFIFVFLNQELVVTDNLTIDGSVAAAPVLIDVRAEEDSVIRRAMRVESLAEAELKSLIIRGGRIDSPPGAIYPANGGGAILNEGTLAMDRCTLYDNEGGSFGGAITNNGGSLVLTQCTLSGNSVVNQGGALHNFHGSAELVFCTVKLNSAALGGGVYNQGTCILDNSIVRGNTATLEAPDIYEFGENSFTLNNANLFGSLEGTTRSPDGTFVLVSSTAVLPLDEQQGPWPLPVHPLGVVSAAVDAALGDEIPATDQRGRPRGVGGSPLPDLGAFERGRVVFVNLSASGTGSGNLWANARTDLNSALTAGIKDDLIWIVGGTYTPAGPGDRTSGFILDPGVSLIGGFPSSGTPRFEDRDPGLHETILSGDIGTSGDSTDNCYHVVQASGFTGTTPSSDLFSLTITGGRADGAGIHQNRGGGLLIRDNADITVSDCTFRDNHAADFGGAVSVIDRPTSFIGCIFRENTSGGDGGALHQTYDQNDAATFPLTVTGCRFTGNSAADFGGAVRLTRSEFTTTISATTASIEASRFLDNSSGSGGGALRVDKSNVMLSDCIFRANVATNTGGAVDANSQTDLTAHDCLFQGNVAGFDGGALYLTTSQSAADLLNCSFQGNRADRKGGALFLNGPDLSLRNSLIWDNSALGSTAVQSSSIGLLADPDTLPPDPSSLPRNNLAGEHVVRSMVQNWSVTELRPSLPESNFAPADPMFVVTIAPGQAPATGGDLRLVEGSPFIGVGLWTENADGTDVVGEPRTTPDGFSNLLNLGAHQGIVSTDYLSDDDNDGLVKALEEAFGTDPMTADSGHANRPKLFINPNDALFRVFYVDRSIPIRITRSTDLVDFSEVLFDGRTDLPGETLIDLRDLRLSTEPRAFYRVELVGP